jgi:hypothetical protein
MAIYPISIRVFFSMYLLTASVAFPLHSQGARCNTTTVKEQPLSMLHWHDLLFQAQDDSN